MPNSILDKAISPATAVEALAARGIRISERSLREKARRIGAYREIGQAMFFLPADLEKIMEPDAAPIKRTIAKARSGSSKAREDGIAPKLSVEGPGRPQRAASPKDTSAKIEPLPFRNPRKSRPKR